MCKQLSEIIYVFYVFVYCIENTIFYKHVSDCKKCYSIVEAMLISYISWSVLKKKQMIDIIEYPNRCYVNWLGVRKEY